MPDPEPTAAPAEASADVSGQPTATAVPEAKPEPELEIITRLRRDGIQAIFDPTFVTVSEAGVFMRDEELVIGLTIDGDSRAYSVAYLSGHEVVNDVVGGKPVAVTW